MGEALDAVNKFYALWAQRDLDGADALFADDCVFLTPAGEMKKAEHRMLGESFMGGFPDSKMNVSNSLEGDGEVFVEGRFTGTHTGDLASPQGTIPATNKSIDLPYAEYFRVEGGKITAQRTYWDQATMMGQLGLMPG